MKKNSKPKIVVKKRDSDLSGKCSTLKVSKATIIYKAVPARNGYDRFVPIKDNSKEEK